MGSKGWVVEACELVGWGGGHRLRPGVRSVGGSGGGETGLHEDAR